MIANDPSRQYEMTFVNSTTVTLSSADPVSASGQAWAISGSETDPGAVDLSFNPGSIGFSSEDGTTTGCGTRTAR